MNRFTMGSKRPVTGPVTEGLDPEAGTDLQPAEPETTMHHDRARKYGLIAAGIVVVWLTADRSEETMSATARGRMRR